MQVYDGQTCNCGGRTPIGSPKKDSRANLIPKIQTTFNLSPRKEVRGVVSNSEYHEARDTCDPAVCQQETQTENDVVAFETDEVIEIGEPRFNSSFNEDGLSFDEGSGAAGDCFESSIKESPYISHNSSMCRSFVSDVTDSFIDALSNLDVSGVCHDHSFKQGDGVWNCMFVLILITLLYMKPLKSNVPFTSGVAFTN